MRGALWTLRGYEVERRIGRGGSGDVWRAHVTATGEPVALKRMALRDAERARREAAKLATLDHPHLVRLHALVAGADVSVLVLDLADGGSLAELLAARGRLTPGEVITAVAPVAAALAYLHGAGVVHGDVSPGNILFTREGIPLLADLGVARLTGDEADAESTPSYVDPVVAEGGIPIPASDVFMLGAVALHALTGTPPWEATSTDERLAAARVGDIDDLAGRLARAGVNDEMAEVVIRALEAEPAHRGTAAEFALELRTSGEPVAVELSAGRILATPPERRRVGGPRHAAVVPTPPPTRSLRPRPRPTLPRGRWRPPARLWIAAAVVLVALLAGAVLWSPWSGGTPSARRDGRSGPVAPRASAVSTPLVSPTPPSPVARTPAVRPRPISWPQRLVALDRVRELAFATRRPELLRQVYVAGPLLIADTRLLMQLVPVGCGLVGARTSYRDVRASVHATAAELTVVAALPETRLVCPGRATTTAAGTGPMTLHVRLVRVGGAWRIVRQVSG